MFRSGDLIHIQFIYKKENRVGVYDYTNSSGIWVISLVNPQKYLSYIISPNAIKTTKKIQLKNLARYKFAEKEEILSWFKLNSIESLLTHFSESLRNFAKAALPLDE